MSTQFDADAAPCAAADKRIGVGPLAGKVGYALRRAQLAVFDEIITAFAELELRPAQYSVLVLLEHAPGSKQSDVAGALGIQRANFVALFDRPGAPWAGPSQPHAQRPPLLRPLFDRSGSEMLARADRIDAQLEVRLDARLDPGGREQLLKLLGQVLARG